MTRRVTGVIADLLPEMMPDGSKQWGSAMRNEIYSIKGAGSAFLFAAGCIRVCFSERMKEMEFKLKLGRYALMISMIGIAILMSTSITSVYQAHAPTGMIFSGLMVAFSVTALWTIFRGVEALIQGASSMLLLNLAAFAVLQSTSGGDEVWVNLEFYRALAFEGIGIWGALLLGGIALWWLPRSKYAQTT